MPLPDTPVCLDPVVALEAAYKLVCSSSQVTPQLTSCHVHAMQASRTVRSEQSDISVIDGRRVGNIAK